MKKNNFFITILLGMLFGMNFEVRSSEGFAASLVIGSVVALAVAKTIKNSATYKTYSQNQNRLAQEKEESGSPWLYAESLSIQPSQNSTEDKS